MEPIPDDPGRHGAVGIVLRRGRMLVIRRARHVVAPLVYCFPGGGIEGDESEEEALVREFREEVGVTLRPVRRLWECVTPWKVHLAWWLGAVEADAVPVANPRPKWLRSIGSRRKRWPSCPICWRAIGGSSTCWPAGKSPSSRSTAEGGWVARPRRSEGRASAGWHLPERSEGRAPAVRHALRSSGRATQTRSALWQPLTAAAVLPGAASRHHSGD